MFDTTSVNIWCFNRVCVLLEESVFDPDNRFAGIIVGGTGAIDLAGQARSIAPVLGLPSSSDEKDFSQNIHIVW